MAKMKMSSKRVLKHRIILHKTSVKRSKLLKINLKPNILSKNQNQESLLNVIDESLDVIDGPNHVLNNAPQESATEESAYIQDKEAAKRLWESQRIEVKEAFLDSLVFDNYPCEICGVLEASFRCNDCGLINLCKECLRKQHTFVKLHCCVKWDGISYKSFGVDECFIFGSAHAKRCSSKFQRMIDIVDIQGRLHYQCPFVFCNCTCITSQLYGMGLWPNYPKDPTIIFDRQLLRIANSLQMEARVSIYSICASFKWLNKLKWTQQYDFYQALIYFESMSEFKFIEESILMLHDRSVTCPCCYKNTCKIFIMDGNFAAVHKRSASKLKSSPRYSSLMFRSSNSEEEYFEYESVDDGCRNFRAGEFIASKETKKKLDVQGLFGVVCRHEFWRLMMDMPTGERYCYGMRAIKQILSEESSNVNFIFIYDIACKLQSYLTSRDTDLMSKFTLAIDQFHSYGHKSECQLFKSVRSTEGAGLTCGSQLERQWPPIRRSSPQTKEMSLSNRQDYLTSLALHENFKRRICIGLWLQRRMKHFHSVSKEVDGKLADLALQLSVNLDENTISDWVQVEKQRFVTPIRYSGRLALLKKLQDLAVEREFILALIRRYPVGQKVNKRLNRQLRRQENQRQTVLVSLQVNHAISITVRETLDLHSSIFDELSSDDESDIPRTCRLEAIRLFQLRSRCREEHEMLCLDTISAIGFYKNQLTEAIKLSNADFRLKAHFYALHTTYKQILLLLQKFIDSNFDSDNFTDTLCFDNLQSDSEDQSSDSDSDF